MAGSQSEITARGTQDTVARRRLLHSHWQGLCRFVRRRVGRRIRCRETSMDVAQSVYREALESLENVELRGSGSFRRWLFLRAEHKIRDRGKYWARDKRAVDRETGFSVPREGALEPEALLDLLTPSRCAVAREELERLERAFDDLPPDYRRVVLLARVAGRSHEEIARELDRTPSATRTILSRALARLALALEEQ